ncbi:MAG: arylsulfatase [Spirochaetes bacterium RBG_13_68_11]|nr:MAG: arylsulfatase [Spirochaetes bacterium RBG_13_68_11]
MSASARPNVIVFHTDQQRWDSTGVHGNPLGLTPNFDRAAMEGTHLFNSFTCQPVCAPSRASLQTGLFATSTGVFRNGIPMRRDLPTLAGCFRGAGYRTAYIGKWHLASHPGAPRGPVAEADRAGYEEWLAADALEHTSEEYRTVLYDTDGKPVRLPGYRVDALADAAIRFIDRQSSSQPSQPFFLFLSFLEPHFQNHRDDYPAPDGYAERYQGRWLPADLAALGGSSHQHFGGYCGMVKRLDEAFGRIRDALKSLDLGERTIVLFTSDHGCHFKTRNDEYKRSCHESSIRVPTLLVGPGFDGGGRVRELVSMVDLPPTLLDAAGIPAPPSLHGRSVMPLIRSERQGWPDHVFIQISEAQIGRAVRTARWKYSVSAPGKNGWDEPAADSYEEEFLYDLRADPCELTNLVGLESHRAVADRLRSLLLGRIREVEGRDAAIAPAPSRPAGQRRVAPEEIGE